MRVDDYCYAVIRGGKLTMPQQAALWMFAYYVNHATGATWASFARIGRDCGVSARQISEHAHALAAAGVFRMSDRVNGRSQLIEFPLHPTLTGYDATPAPERGGSCPQPLPSSAGANSRSPLRSSAPTPALQRANPRAGVPPNSYEPVKEPARAGPVDNSDDPTPAWFKDRLPPRMMWEVSM